MVGASYGYEKHDALFSVHITDVMSYVSTIGFRASWVRNYGERKRLMGGDYGYTGSVSGTMALLLEYNRTPHGSNIGFRASELW